MSVSTWELRRHSKAVIYVSMSAWTSPEYNRAQLSHAIMLGEGKRLQLREPQLRPNETLCGRYNMHMIVVMIVIFDNLFEKVLDNGTRGQSDLYSVYL